MSVQAYDTDDGRRWRVRWRENDRMRSRSFGGKREALAFDADVKARKFRGDMIPRSGRKTLARAYEEWWPGVEATKAINTQRSYKAQWNAHIKNTFDHHTLGELVAQPSLIDDLMHRLHDEGVGRPSQRKTLIVLSALLADRVRVGEITTNPAHRALKPKLPPRRAVRPFAPVVIERIRLAVAGRDVKARSGARADGDALLIAVMAYAGLRPQEALALEWGDVGDRVLTVDKAASFGEEKATKTEHVRTVPIPPTLLGDLDGWKATTGAPTDHALVFPGVAGALWSHSAYNNWRGRVWKAALRTVADSDPNLAPLAKARPYDCRHSFVSLHLRAGEDPLRVATWAGHSPSVMWRHYAHVIEDLRGGRSVAVEQQIAAAREAVTGRPADEVRAIVAEGFTNPEATPVGFGPALFGARKIDRDQESD